MDNALLSNASHEWYTPKHIIDMVLEVFPCIDFDPFSSEEANKTVGAAQFFTKSDDAFSKAWPDVDYVFVNPPGPVKGDKSTAKNVRKAWDKVLETAFTSDTIWVGFSLEQLATLQDSAESPLDYTTVILRNRVKFMGAGTSPTHSNYITLVSLSEELRDTFIRVFSRIGQVASVRN